MNHNYSGRSLRHRLAARPLTSHLCSTLLTAGVLLSVTASAQQLVPLPRVNAGIPTLVAAKKQEAQRSRPIEQVLVKLRPGISPQMFAREFSALTSVEAKANGVQVSEATASPVLRFLRSNLKLGWHTFRLPKASDLPFTLEALRNNPQVLKAEPNYHLKTLSLPPPNDPYWNLEDWVHTTAVLSGFATDRASARDVDSSYWTYSWPVQTVNALDAWGTWPGKYYTAADRLALMSSNPARLPLVAVIDSGLDMNHPDLGYGSLNTVNRTDISKGGQVQKSLARSFTLGNTDTNPDLATDEFGHGTSVAGIIGAAPNNGIGITGLGFPARIVPVRVIDGEGNGDDSDLLDSITYAVDSKCVLINASLTTDTTQFPQALQDAVDYAWNHGTLIIAGAGNDATTDGLNSVPLLADTRRYPAACVGVLAVSATSYGGLDPSDATLNGFPYGGETKANYSNANQAVGICAPGGNISTFENFAPSGIELGLGTLQQYVLDWTLAPSYTVALSDANGPFGTYAQVGLYGLDYGMIQGTSFACPHVTALAALYASKNALVQAPGTPAKIMQALQRGAANLNGRFDGGWDKNFGYGRIDAAQTVLDANARNTTLGGAIGQVTVGGTPINNVNVSFQRVGGTRRYSGVTFPDGIYHAVNIPQGDYVVTASAFGYAASQTVTIKAGCDLHGLNFPLGPSAPITVTIAPRSVTLPYGAQKQFTSIVSGTDNQTVIWSLPVDAGATISTTGLLTAPAKPGASQQAIVRANSVVDPSKFDSTVVTFQPAALNPTADTYVRSGSASSQNFSGDSRLVVKRIAAASNGNNRAAYLKFDLTSLIYAPKSAMLTLTNASPTGPSTQSVKVNLYSVADTTWTETGLTCNNAPGLNRATFTSTGTLVASQTVPLTIGTSTSFDLTAFVAANLGKVVTLQIMNDIPAFDFNLLFFTREAASGAPVLQFTY